LGPFYTWNRIRNRSLNRNLNWNLNLNRNLEKDHGSGSGSDRGKIIRPWRLRFRFRLRLIFRLRNSSLRYKQPFLKAGVIRLAQSKFFPLAPLLGESLSFVSIYLSLSYLIYLVCPVCFIFLFPVFFLSSSGSKPC
jgi:hypothetical protein